MAYFKKSFSRKANYVREGEKYKLVGEGNGDYILVRTAKDKAIREERDNYYSSLPIPHVVAIHNFPSRTWWVKIWSKKDVEWFWRFYNYDPEKMKAAVKEQRNRVRYAQARCLVSSLRQHGWLDNETAWAYPMELRRKVTIAGYTYRPDASPGYVEYDRLSLAYQQMVLHNWEMAVRAWDYKPYTWNL